jgi:hypothetical protein
MRSTSDAIERVVVKVHRKWPDLAAMNPPFIRSCFAR